jgi:hypothetical protein
MTSAADRFTTAQRELAKKGIRLAMRPQGFVVRYAKGDATGRVCDDMDEAIAFGRAMAPAPSETAPAPRKPAKRPRKRSTPKSRWKARILRHNAKVARRKKPVDEI